MESKLNEAEINAALQTCANEPVHIPGIVQTFGCLVSVAIETSAISYASENCEAFLGRSADALLGCDARDVFGSEPWHGVRNAVSRSSIGSQTISAGRHSFGDQLCDLRVHQSDDQYVIEVERANDPDLDGPEGLKTLGFLMAQIQNCKTEQQLFQLTVDVLQHLSGYDRVLIYRFDPEWNGEVLTEVKQGPFESLLGLRFPHWDIPAQARAIMERLPLRFIENIDQEPVPILALSGMPPLDITLAPLRGVSPVHMEYLRNMGIAATMTLSIVVNNQLWGIISFHHRRPKVPSSGLREVLGSFLMVFCGKLEAIQQQVALDRIKALDQGFVVQAEEEMDLVELLPAAATVIMEVMQAQGIATIMGDEVIGSGDLPSQQVMQVLSQEALTAGTSISAEALAERYPDHAEELDGVAGALAVPVTPHRAIMIFRNEIERETAWAGNPEKTIEKVGDRVRLSPRGSFSTFLELVRGRSESWSETDHYLGDHLRTLMHAAERQAVMNKMNRQQALMIGELNHRVRNILALVRSVSRQARRRYASLDSYANAIENRIRALAAAHDISGGRSTDPVSIYDLIRLEFEPFRPITEVQTRIEGPELFLLPEVAPIFSLVIHELTTNAAKYGALLNEEGRIAISLVKSQEDLTIHWLETGGPGVSRPNDLGFGMALIEQAVPHELGGTAKVTFDGQGLRAEFNLPLRHFVDRPARDMMPRNVPIELEENVDLPDILRTGTVMVLEDNYIIAKEMADQLRDLGCADVRTSSSVETAMDTIEHEELILAVLDVNLGPNQTSEAVAKRLAEDGVPFVFVTGYGEGGDLPAIADQAPKLTKPISTTEFIKVVSQLLSDR